MYEDLKKIIDECSNIVFFGGAGVSTESGIPDFRSETGLYHAKQKYGYPPETMLSHSFYVRHKDTFFEYYKENLIYDDAAPNKAHLALAALEKAGKLKAVITQNIDGLHQKAGSKTVYELHGSVLRNYCEKCGASYPLSYIMDPENCDGFVPRCSRKKGESVCGGAVKPDVVLYEEPLDDGIMNGALNAIMKADCMIIGGTSLNVYPAAGLIYYFHGKHLVLINRDSTPFDSKADLVIHDKIGEVLGEVVGI